MKLRIKGNSLRLRLTRSEVERLTTHGCVEERTSFGNNLELVYALLVKECNELYANLDGSAITVFIPVSFLKDWARNDVVTFCGSMPVGKNEALSIIVEKDFKCIDATAEDQSDNYENPNKAC